MLGAGRQRVPRHPCCGPANTTEASKREVSVCASCNCLARASLAVSVVFVREESGCLGRRSLAQKFLGRMISADGSMMVHRVTHLPSARHALPMMRSTVSGDGLTRFDARRGSKTMILLEIACCMDHPHSVN